jgi:hypothetical protein
MRGLVAILSAIYLLFSAHAAVADKRVAFVVGNGAYKNVAQLPNPPFDAEAMATALRNVGFEVVEGINLTREKMAEKLLAFGKKAQRADIAVFFYAGHGIAISGTNYLLAIDADIKSEMDVKLGAAINIDLALDQTMGDAKVKLVFLDACRDNPFTARIKSYSASAVRSVSVQQGLAEMKSGEGTLIAFATGPGQTALDGQEGTNSPFTRALIDHITKPGVEIQQAMTEVRAQVNEETSKGQLPWGHTNLIGSVYLNPATTPNDAQAPAARTSMAAVDNNTPEVEFWRSIKESNKLEELNAYLTKYPNGQFRSLAQARIASIEKGPSTTTRGAGTGVDPETYTEKASQSTENQIGLDKGQRRDVQRRLTGLGFDAKVNGKFDDSTRANIMRWQAARGYPETGFLNELQHKALLAEIVSSGGFVGGLFHDDPSDRTNRDGRKSGGGGRSGRNPPPMPTPTPELALPDFPWPPPTPSTYYVLPEALLNDRHTLGEATDAIVSALERTGYVERTFFRTKPGGIALVTRLERIEPDGTSARPERWSLSDKKFDSVRDVANFLRGLFFVEEGHYRLIVFVLQKDPFIPAAQEMVEQEARDLIKSGANILPPAAAQKSYDGSHCTVMVYEFTSGGKAAHFVKQSPLTAKEHLTKAGLLSLLGKNN